VTSQLQQHTASSQRFKDVRCCTTERQAFPKERSTFLLGLDASEGRSVKTHVPQVRTSPANTERSQAVVWHKETADRVLIVESPLGWRYKSWCAGDIRSAVFLELMHLQPATTRNQQGWYTSSSSYE